MRRSYRFALITLVVLGGTLLAEPNENPQKKAAQAAIVKLSENLNAPDVAMQAKAIVRQHESDAISSVFARNSRGGLGVGNAARMKHRDGIELLIVDYSRKAPTQKELDDHHADMLKVARVISAMAELAPYRLPAHPAVNARLAKEWMEVSKEFKEGATHFREAVESKQPDKIKTGAGKLNNTCCHCHGLL